MSVSLETARQAARYLATPDPEEDAALAELRDVGGSAPLRRSLRRSVAAERVLSKSEEMGILASLSDEQGRLAFQILKDDDLRFLKGIWLELLVWDEARRLTSLDGGPLFDDCVDDRELLGGSERGGRGVHVPGPADLVLL